jgi:hypothetical protein
LVRLTRGAWGPRDALAVARILGRAGLLVSFADLCHLRTPDGWDSLAHGSYAPVAFANALETYCPQQGTQVATFPVDLPMPATLEEAPMSEAWVRTGWEPCDPRGPELAHLAGPSGRALVPQIEGWLRSPVIDPPKGWISLFDETLPPADPACPHLRELFAGFDLGRHSLLPLYAYLFGCFHGVSLKYERPILFIDSWVRGRGKSEVGRAFSVLLDGCDSSLPLSDTASSSDLITSFLVNGQRILPLQNLDGRWQYQDHFLVSLATDGSVNARPKYSRNSAQFRGVCAIMNGVWGSFSLHKDLLTRVWRAELPGVAQQLHPRPVYYALEYRLPILSEILSLLTPAVPQYTGVSRHQPFEAVGVTAASKLLGLSIEEGLEIFSRSYRGAQGLGHPAVSHFYKHTENNIDARQRLVPPSEEEPPHGCYVLGHELRSVEGRTHWRRVIGDRH